MFSGISLNFIVISAPVPLSQVLPRLFPYRYILLLKHIGGYLSAH